MVTSTLCLPSIPKNTYRTFDGQTLPRLDDVAGNENFFSRPPSKNGGCSAVPKGEWQILLHGIFVAAELAGKKKDGPKPLSRSGTCIYQDHSESIFYEVIEEIHLDDAPKRSKNFVVVYL
jgi:hypothetical protein